MCLLQHGAATLLGRHELMRSSRWAAIPGVSSPCAQASSSWLSSGCRIAYYYLFFISVLFLYLLCMPNIDFSSISTGPGPSNAHNHCGHHTCPVPYHILPGSTNPSREQRLQTLTTVWFSVPGRWTAQCPNTISETGGMCSYPAGCRRSACQHHRVGQIQQEAFAIDSVATGCSCV